MPRSPLYWTPTYEGGPEARPMKSRRNPEGEENQGCCSRPKVDWPCEIPSQIPRQPFADVRTNVCVWPRTQPLLHLWKKNHSVDQPQTTSINRDQATCFNTQTPPVTPTPIATIPRRNQIQTRQGDVPGGHPVQSIPTEQPTIRSRERSREHARGRLSSYLQAATRGDPEGNVKRPNPSSGKEGRLGGMA